jgi:FtsH-binding integral membrane protein
LLLSAGYILYDTSFVLHHYRIGQHVAASLALFSSLALMFWYMVQLVMSLNSRD